MTPDQQDWQDELREQIQGARHMAEVSPDLVRRALIHMDAAVREVGRLQAAHAADLARLRALEEEVARLKALLDKAAPHICPSCGPHARVDEEGCCAACGADTHFDSDPYAALHAQDAEADAATERVQHLLTTIDVERTGRKEAAEEVARLRGALEEAEAVIDICEHRPPGGQQVTPPPYNMTPYTRKVLQRILHAALHAQDTEVGR